MSVLKAQFTNSTLITFIIFLALKLLMAKKCKKQFEKTGTNTYKCPQCTTEYGECDFSYVLKMNLQDDIGELLKEIAFEGPANTLLGVGDFLLLLVEPNVANDVLDKVVNCQFLIQLSITMKHFFGQVLQSIVITTFKAI